MQTGELAQKINSGGWGALTLSEKAEVLTGFGAIYPLLDTKAQIEISGEVSTALSGGVMPKLESPLFQMPWIATEPVAARVDVSTEDCITRLELARRLRITGRGVDGLVARGAIRAIHLSRKTVRYSWQEVVKRYLRATA